MKKYILLIISLLPLYLMAQEKLTVCDVYYAKDTSFTNILKEFIENEHQNSYYTDSSVFLVQIFKVDTCILYILNSGTESEHSFIQDSTVFWESSIGQIFVLNSNDHYFYCRFVNCSVAQLPFIKATYSLPITEVRNAEIAPNIIIPFDDEPLQTYWKIISCNNNFEILSKTYY